ncbi:MAG: tol-pal system YbgF family protein [Sumerlaeia bacterium]
MFPIRLTLLFTLTVFLGSCAIFGSRSKTELLIPREDDVQGQFEVAFSKEKDARSYFDENKRAEEMEVAILAYEKVELWFPNDKRLTPVAALKVAVIEAELGDYTRAAKSYEHVLKQYPSDTEVRINALLGLGNCLDELKRPSEAQVYYKLLIDEFQTTTNPRYKTLVEQARNNYRQIR